MISEARSTNKSNYVDIVSRLLLFIGLIALKWGFDNSLLCFMQKLMSIESNSTNKITSLTKSNNKEVCVRILFLSTKMESVLCWIYT